MLVKKYAILGIDLQDDFVNATGALSVVGAEDDAKRIADLIKRDGDKISHITMTMDSHRGNHIAHASYWQDKNGNHPAPYTQISAQEARDGVWTALINPLGAIQYLEELEKNGQKHTIWPEHCILGSKGWALYKDISDSIIEWEIKNRIPFNLEFKGSNWFTEHYSIFKSIVTLPNYPETALNQGLLTTLNKYDTVFLCGEAADFCVANSLNDILNETPDLAKKVVVLEDCMSWIIAGNPSAVAIFDKAKQMGVQFKKSTDNNLFV